MDKDLLEKMAALRGGSVKKYNTSLGSESVNKVSGQSGSSISNLVASAVDPAIMNASTQNPATISSLLPDDPEFDVDFLSPPHFASQQRTLFSAYGFVCQEYKSAYDDLLKKGAPSQSDLDDLLGWAIEVEERHIDFCLLTASQDFNDAGWMMNTLLKDLRKVEFGTEAYDKAYRQLSLQKNVLLQVNTQRLEEAKNKQLFAEAPISQDLKGKSLSVLLGKVYKHCMPVIAEYEKKLQEDDVSELEFLYNELYGDEPQPEFFLEIK